MLGIDHLIKLSYEQSHYVASFTPDWDCQGNYTINREGINKKIPESLLANHLTQSDFPLYLRRYRLLTHNMLW